MKNKIELLAPAGNLEKLKVAIEYGADAVYIGGNKYGLRAKSKNFTYPEFLEGIKYAHDRGVKVYLTANIFANNREFSGMEKYFKELEEVGVDAIIVADPGVYSVVKTAVPNMEVHISTQANVTNYHGVNFWASQGAKRVILARELSLREIKEIRENVDLSIDIETFVHGSMCMAYSGRCLLSNYILNRDANKGVCANVCRWEYNLVERNRPNEAMPIYEDEKGTYIYNSKDLCTIDLIPSLVESGINSFKIEGRRKSEYYLATVVKIYKEAINDYLENPEKYESKKKYYLDELRKTSHRDFTTGFFLSKPGKDDHVYESNSYIRNYDFCAIVLDYDAETKLATVEQRYKFVKGETLEHFSVTGTFNEFVIEEMYDDEGNEIDSAPHPQQIIKFKTEIPMKKYDFIRKHIDDVTFLP